MAGGDTSGWFLRLRRHRLLQRLVELDVQAAHALGEPAELHVDAAAAPRHHGHRAGHVADGPDVRGERALSHLRGLFRDPLAQLLDGVRRGGAVRLELGDQVLHDVDGPLKLVDLLDAAQLLGGEFLLRHGRAQGLPSSASANTRPSSGSAGRSTRATPGRARNRAATPASTLSTSTPWAASLARSASTSRPVSNWSQAAPPTRPSSAALTPSRMLSGTTRTALGWPSARERSGNGVTP